MFDARSSSVRVDRMNLDKRLMPTRLIRVLLESGFGEQASFASVATPSEKGPAGAAHQSQRLPFEFVAQLMTLGER